MTDQEFLKKGYNMYFLILSAAVSFVAAPAVPAIIEGSRDPVAIVLFLLQVVVVCYLVYCLVILNSKQHPTENVDDRKENECG